MGGGAPQVAESMQTVKAAPAPAAPAVDPIDVGLSGAEAMHAYADKNLAKDRPSGFSDFEGAAYGVASFVKPVLAQRLADKKEATAKRMAENLVAMGFSPTDAAVMASDKITRQAKMQNWQDEKKGDRRWEREKEKLRLLHGYSLEQDRQKADLKRMGEGPQFMHSDSLGRDVMVEYYKEEDGSVRARPAGLDRGRKIDDLRVLSPAEQKYHEEVQKAKGKEHGKADTKLFVALQNAYSIKQALAGLSDENVREYVGSGLWNQSVDPVTDRGIAARAAFNRVKGGTFLIGFDMLRGGGAITQAEGEKASAALSTIEQGTTYAAIMKASAELKEIVRIGLLRARAATGDPKARAQMLAPRSQGGLGLTDEELREEIAQTRARAYLEAQKERKKRASATEKGASGDTKLPGGAEAIETEDEKVRVE